MKIERLACLAGGVLFCLLCHLQAGEAPPAQPEVKVKVAAAEDADTVVMELEDIKIPAKDIWALEKAVLQVFQKRQPNYTPTPQDRAMLRRQLAQQRLGVALIQKLATEHPAEITDADVEKRMQNVRMALESRKIAYDDFIVGKGCLKPDEFLAVTRAGMTLERSLAKTVSEEDVKAAFDKHSQGLPLRRCSHVLYGYKGAKSVQATRTKDEAKKLAEEVLVKIKADKDFDFAQLARETSDCTSKGRGGDLNFSPLKGEGQMVPAFAEALYALPEVGAYSDVVETDFGFHVIKLTELRSIKDFEPVIRQQMAQQQIGKLIQQKMGEKEKNLKVNTDLLAMLPPGEKVPEAPAPKKAPEPKAEPKPEPKP